MFKKVDNEGGELLFQNSRCGGEQNGIIDHEQWTKRLSLLMAQFHKLGTINALGQTILCCGAVLCRVFSSILDLCPLNASSKPPAVTTKKSPDITKYLLGKAGAKLPLVGNH